MSPLVPVEEIDNSHMLLLPNGLLRPVKRVETYDEPEGTAFVVVYADDTMYARDGARSVAGLEKSLRSMHAGELVKVAA